MDRQTLDTLIASYIDREVETYFPNGAGQMTEARLRRALETVAQRVESDARAYYLGNLRTVDDLVARYNISRRRAQAIAKDHHERWGKGMMVGGTYIFSDDELATMEPGEPGRPPNSSRV